MFHDVGDPSDDVTLETSVVHRLDHFDGGGQPHLRERQVREQRCRATLIELPHHCRKRGAADPEATTLVSQQIAPPACARRPPSRTSPIRNRPGSGDDDHAGVVADAGDERDECVVDDHRGHVRTDSADDIANRVGILLPVSAGNPDADRLRRHSAMGEHVFHEPAKNALDLELSGGAEVGPAAPRFGDHPSALVGQLTDGLGPAGIDADDIHNIGPAKGCENIKAQSPWLAQVWYIPLSFMLRRVSRFRHRRRLARLVLCVVIGLMVADAPRMFARAASDSPIRGYWIARTALDSSDGVRRAIGAAVAGAFDTVFVPIALTAEDAPSGFDGVRELIREARDRRLRVQAWIDVNRVAVGDEFPSSRSHVIYQHPEWLMLPRELAPELLPMDPRVPAYLGRLSRWTRSNRDRVDGLYLSPLDPEAASYVAGLVSATVRRYAVDGVYFDAVRFPGNDFDYSRRALDLFRGFERPRLSVAERARLDEVEAIDPFGYPSEFPVEWAAFRQARLTALITRLRASLKVINPLVTVTASIAADDATAREQQFQDWRSWITERLIDGVGRRNGNGITILLAPDGLPPEPARLSIVVGQASAVGAPR